MADTLADIRHFFDACAANWDADMVLDPRKMRAIVALADMQGGAQVLDIACGTGVLVPFLLECEPERVTGVDLSPNMIEKARENCADVRVSFRMQDFLRFVAAPFDAAVCYNAYPHFMDKAAFARQAAALLRPGARLTIAHGAGRAKINAHHGSAAVSHVSVGLRSAAEEAEALAPYFAVDTLVDTAALYVLSGVKR